MSVWVIPRRVYLASNGELREALDRMITDGTLIIDNHH